MKKILAIALTWVLFATVSISQTTVSTKDSKTNCIPTKECAAKAGMTLEECKKICTAKADASTTSVASASMVADTKEAKKSCCASMKECAAKMGMTEAECKAKCAGKSKTAMTDDQTESKVASAVKVNQIEQVTAEKAPAKKCSKTCTKKKG